MTAREIQDVSLMFRLNSRLGLEVINIPNHNGDNPL